MVKVEQQEGAGELEILLPNLCFRQLSIASLSHDAIAQMFIVSTTLESSG